MKSFRLRLVFWDHNLSRSASRSWGKAHEGTSLEESKVSAETHKGVKTRGMGLIICGYTVVWRIGFMYSEKAQQVCGRSQQPGTFGGINGPVG